MHRLVRIGGVSTSVLAACALLAVALTWAMTHRGFNLGANGASVFVGLMVSGVVGAILTKDAGSYA